jgi:hypothetical protein
VCFDRKNRVTLEGWRAAISKLDYPLVLPDALDPSDTNGYLDCSYNSHETSIAIDLNEECELPSPFSEEIDRIAMEFTVNTVHGESAWFAAVAAAASFCVATGGVVEDDDCARFTSRRVRSWANSILKEDDVIARAAAQYAHPDAEPVSAVKGPPESWWKWWRRT